MPWRQKIAKTGDFWTNRSGNTDFIKEVIICEFDLCKSFQHFPLENALDFNFENNSLWFIRIVIRSLPLFTLFGLLTRQTQKRLYLKRSNFQRSFVNSEFLWRFLTDVYYQPFKKVRPWLVIISHRNRSYFSSKTSVKLQFWRFTI